ncbi:MAG: hypothetical protein HY908_33360 [Myxococcales bacterium]|nr:hypothetical protein [Myxococcales bacterium]
MSGGAWRAWPALCALGAVACGGGMPLLHPAHVLGAGDTTVGAGFAGQVAVPARAADASVATRAIHGGAVAAGIAPWVAGRTGIDGSFEAGLGYSGRALRADVRYAIPIDQTALSFGLGASALLPRRDEDIGARVSGGGGDLPILFGWCNPSDVYCAWLGARGGFDILTGSHELALDPTAPLALPDTESVKGFHVYGGGLVGLRIGFRYVFAAIELGLTMHYAKGDVGAESVEVRQFALTPAGGIVGHF